MVAAYGKGFEKEAEAISEEIRTELGIGNIRPIDPAALAVHLETPAWSLAQLGSARNQDPDLDRALEVLYGPEQSSLSAVTVFFGDKRLIVYNERNPAPRQASDLCHELAHGLLLHVPAPALDSAGCRAWNSVMEDEANYLGGALLIPGKGARYSAKCQLTDEQTAQRFRCSVEMATWRINVSGARRILTR